MPVLTTQDAGKLVPALAGPAGQKLAEAAFKLLAIDRLNALYDSLSPLEGPDFAAAFLKAIGVDYQIGNPERLDSLPQGPFITVSNHPYGHIDGISMIDLFGHIRPGYRIMVNRLLGYLDALRDNFVTVVPTGAERTAARPESICGVRQALEQVRGGGVLSIMPSGAVSDLSLKDGCIRDRKWQDAAIKLIRKAGVPVVPVRFFDTNSMFYYILRGISSNVRLMRLPSELFNKSGKTVRLALGETISVEAQRSCGNLEEYGAMLRSSVYGMELPSAFVRRSELDL